MVEIDPVASAFWRLLLAAPLLFIMSRLFVQAAPKRTVIESRGRRMALLAGLAFAADLGVWHYAIAYTSVANATLLANLAPVFIALWIWWYLRRSLSVAYWSGLLLALFGAAVLVGANFAQPGALLGDGLGVLTALFYAIYQLAVADARKTLGTWQLMWISTVVAAMLLLPFALFSGDWWPDTPQQWLWLLALALISHVLGQGLIAYALAHLSSAFSSVSLLIQPVAAAIFAWLLLAESLGWLQALGAVLVMLGIVLCRSANARLSPATEGPRTV